MGDTDHLKTYAKHLIKKSKHLPEFIIVPKLVVETVVKLVLHFVQRVELFSIVKNRLL